MTNVMTHNLNPVNLVSKAYYSLFFIISFN